jgi:hypothetical protein
MADFELSHAVVATGEDTTELPGGRSRQTALGVPVLELRDELAQVVSQSAQAALDPEVETEHLAGSRVVLHNPQPTDGIAPDDNEVVFTVGAETLDEAAKTVIGVYEAVYATRPPEWVDASNWLLGEVIADHYGCENRSTRND